MPLRASSASAIGTKGEGTELPGQEAEGQRGRSEQGPLPMAPSHHPRGSEQSWAGDCDHSHGDGAAPRPSWGSGLVKDVVRRRQRCSVAWAGTRGEGRSWNVAWAHGGIPAPRRFPAALSPTALSPEPGEGYSAALCGTDLGHTSQNPFGLCGLFRTLSENNNILYIFRRHFFLGA